MGKDLRGAVVLRVWLMADDDDDEFSIDGCEEGWWMFTKVVEWS